MKYKSIKLIGTNFRPGYKHNSRGHDQDKYINLENILDPFGQNYLLGKEISAHTDDGYHYGVLHGYDKEFVYLSNYIFDKNRLSTFDYAAKAGFSKAIVPREKIKAISEIPLTVEKEKEKRYKKR